MQQYGHRIKNYGNFSHHPLPPKLHQGKVPLNVNVSRFSGQGCLLFFLSRRSGRRFPSTTTQSFGTRVLCQPKFTSQSRRTLCQHHTQSLPIVIPLLHTVLLLHGKNLSRLILESSRYCIGVLLHSAHWELHLLFLAQRSCHQPFRRPPEETSTCCPPPSLQFYNSTTSTYRSNSRVPTLCKPSLYRANHITSIHS